MISKQHKVIFVHVPKVAGQSIETMFLNELGLNWDTRASLLLRKKEPNEEGPFRLAHLTASEYVKLNYIDEARFKDYFKFSFVRDPYKRAFSFYNFLGYSKIISFRSFVNHVLPRKLKENDFFFKSQYDYLYSEKGELMVDYLGRLETIKEDIEKVKEICGLKGATLPHVNKSKGEWNRAVGHLVRTPYLWRYFKLNAKKQQFDAVFTQEIKDKVYELYQKDFEPFGYKR
ncbi:sulfotransferase family 2 domain-containing protein [Aureisphaera galaxeae]|uniref:sulfotransferase family 2 domain-containing protein n=1 Tax=Aureisphaera galaxeae TaxID=1538023 RepID=UPI00235084E5|nr:sulfotransferase family 2 domain-containing protein [Aureisphaera galaxeae]MDC8005074.1 sulfotransferase family 2 domain-containing protein [Aureisphaera galaxeae]